MWGSIVIKLWGEKGRNPQRIQAEAYMSGIYHLKQCCGGGGGSHNASQRISEILLGGDVQ